MKNAGSKARRHAGTKSLRQIAVVTGTRAEYGLLRSTMKALSAHRNVRLQLVVTGSHLLAKFGHTIDEILADGWKVDARVRMQRGNDDPLDQPRALARGIAGIAEFLSAQQTDLVVVLGDRIEAMAGALAAVTTGRLVAHIHGGDLAAGDFDDCLRHAITKLAHLHFPATPQAAKRIIRMGEGPWRVHVVGAPGLDRITELMNDSSRKTANSFGNSNRPRALIAQHPCGRAAAKERAVMRNILDSVKQESLEALCVYPNTDRGHRGIIDAINDHARRTNGDFRVLRSLPRDQFLMAMHQADVLIGNSSSGIIEAASLGTPAVNIGPRQQGRQRSGTGVIQSGESRNAIRNALKKALRTRPVDLSSNVYGDGRAGKRIARVLSRVPFDDKLRRKLNSY